ncbi:hypothetical protein D3C71_2039690 [compost metagenome]
MCEPKTAANGAACWASTSLASARVNVSSLKCQIAICCSWRRVMPGQASAIFEKPRLVASAMSAA